MAVTGIYTITAPDGKVYVGQSIDVITRFRGHRNSKGRSQTKLRASFEKHGCESHKFEIIQECRKEKLYEMERHYQDLYDATGENGLNTVLENPKMIRASRSYNNVNKGANHFNYGRVYSSEERGIMAKQQPIKLRGAHQRAKLVMCTQTGVFYDCALDACDAYGYKKARLCNMLAGFDRNLTSLIYV